ncbi:hypothetical protein MIND_01070600 [Mycena indigotica]|uniref:Uncharacterized protein n=1 Tax=Mycena indigotica TaxID=2126181 RepID=A0A8H6SAG6_9AGAR|nr:uncharacterized protein MIND_01070600 [Mycena indigotica]KAF7295313.1 hypothetical protein MIND_01070600 [Mycena indigotica]
MSALQLLLEDAQCWPPHLEPWHSLLTPYPAFFFDQPPSPTETVSSSSSSWSPPPTHVVCNAPLVAPIPLPYHSPKFLQFDLLPDIDEDLSHPPYTTRSRTAALKRKRAEDETINSRQFQKRRMSAPQPATASTGRRGRANLPRR